MKIYQLNNKQQELLDELYFLSGLDDAKRIEEIETELLKIQTSAEETLKYLSTILLQARYDERVAIDETNRLQDLVKLSQLRSKKYTNSKERLTGVMVRICNNFNIKSFQTQYTDFRKTITPGAVSILPGFDIDSIPENFVRVIPEKKELDSNEVLAVLRDKIKVNGKLDEDVKVVVDDSLPGLALIRKESIK